MIYHEEDMGAVSQFFAEVWKKFQFQTKTNSP